MHHVGVSGAGLPPRTPSFRWVSPGLVGTAEIATKLAIDYAEQRKIFAGKPISSYQAIQFPLAEAHIQTECARLMKYKAASLHDAGQPYASEANMGKWAAVYKDIFR